MRRRQTLSSLCVLVTSLLCMQSPVSGQEIGRPQDTTIRTAALAAEQALDAVGRLDIGDDGFCTATLVAPALVLTAAHCLFEGPSTVPVDIDLLTFRAGLHFGEEKARRNIRRMVVHPDYRHVGAPTRDAVAADLALLELDRALDLPTMRPLPVTGELSEGDRVELVSYARTRAHAASREDDCNVITRGPQILVLTCDVDFGASGAPVFYRDPKGLGIASVVSAMTIYEGRRVALAATVEAGLDPLLAEFARAPRMAPRAKTIKPGESASGTIRFSRPER
ncbi:MAG: trypsin-like peptidase domain-containing protein [Pseudomonadota bacterium]